MTDIGLVALILIAPIIIRAIVDNVLDAFLLPFAKSFDGTWARYCTMGLPPDLRDRKLIENDGYVTEFIAELRSQGYQPRPIGFRVATRCLAGMYSDVLWRLRVQPVHAYAAGACSPALFAVGRKSLDVALVVFVRARHLLGVRSGAAGVITRIDERWAPKAQDATAVFLLSVGVPLLRFAGGLTRFATRISLWVDRTLEDACLQRGCPCDCHQVTGEPASTHTSGCLSV